MTNHRIDLRYSNLTCPDCGKRRHPTRSAAKKVARHLGWTGLHPYRCGDFWHLGHLAEDVKRGIVARDVQRKDFR